MQIMKRSGLTPELVEWGDGDGLERLMRRMRSLMAFPEVGEEGFGWSPRVDLVDADGEYVVAAEMPGVPREDIEITYEDGILTLKGEKSVEKEEKQQRYHLWERSHGSFERSLTLPRMVDPDRITAEHRDGVLRIHLPKLAEARGRKIEIGA